MAEVETTREGAVLTITLNRPDVLNAFNTEMQKAFDIVVSDRCQEAVELLRTRYGLADATPYSYLRGLVDAFVSRQDR